MTRDEEWLRLIRYPYEGRVRWEFSELKRIYCPSSWRHVPHIWYSYATFRRHFCKGVE